MSEGLVGGEGFAIDAVSVVKADAARASGISGAAIDYRALGPGQASRAVREYLEGVYVGGRPETTRKKILVRSGGGVDVRSGRSETPPYVLAAALTPSVLNLAPVD